MTQEYIEIPTLTEDENLLPGYGSDKAAGADIRANIKKDLILRAGKSTLIPTGLKVAIPSGYEIQVRPRSGLALNHQVTILNTPGTIDADYRGEIGVILINHSQEDFTITPGMRIAQLIVAPYVQAHYIPANELLETARSAGGFGHTGTH